MSDNILGNVDMVLAISENTINYQFDQLFKQEIIESDWKLLVKTNKKGLPTKVMTGQEQDFDKKLSSWIKTQKKLTQLLNEKNYTEFGRELEKAEKENLLWDYGWSGAISSPIITILPKTTQSLLLEISFTSGSLYYSPGIIKGVSKFDLSGIIYKFNVPIGQLEIASKDIITSDAQNHVQKAIKKTGLSETDFSIQSLFLDFTNAEIANFDPSSKFQEEIAAALQIAITDYFKLYVAKEKNPYILGYGIKVKPIKSKTAIFQPTALSFSTSFSNTKGESAFNFLMMSEKTDFPSGSTVGILPKSLLENKNYENDDSTLDGVFAIDYKLFKKQIISPLLDKISVGADIPSKAKYISQSVQFGGKAQQWFASATADYTIDVNEPVSDLLKETHLIVNYSMNLSFELENGSNDLLWEGKIQFSVDVKVQPWALLHGGRYTAYEGWLSTSGNYKKGPGGNLGQNGTVKMSIKPGANGSLIFSTPQFIQPELGYTKQTTESVGSPFYGYVEGYFDNKYDKADVNDIAQKTFNQVKELVKEIKSSIDDALKDLSNGKIILPLGQLYTFSNIQLYSDLKTDNNPVTLNVSYAPVSN